MSETLDDELSSADLIRRVGGGITSRQIRRWREAGIIPYRVKGQGRGQGHIAVYPERATAQVAEIKRLLDAHLGLDQVTLRLWMDGFDVETEAIRRDVQASLEKYERKFAEEIESTGERIDNAAHRSRYRHPVQSDLLDNFGTRGMAELTGALSHAVEGRTSPRQVGVLTRVLSIITPPLIHKRLKQRNIIEDQLAIGDILALFAAVVQPAILRKAVEDASSDDFHRAQNVFSNFAQEVAADERWESIGYEDSHVLIALTLVLLPFFAQG